MTTMSHEPAAVAPQSWIDHLRIREMWVSLSIAAMWIAVPITAIWGPNATFDNTDGSSSSIPTAVFVTVFAFLGSWIVAKYGFRQQPKK
jgi:predicted permease